MDWSTSAAVIVGLQTLGKPGAELVKDFVGRIFAPAGDALGTALAHPIAEWNKRRAERANQIVTASAQILADANCQAHSVPPYVLLPLLEKASLAEDEDLQVLWAKLLASAASGQTELEVWPSFPAMLSELSAAEAKILQWLYSNVESDPHSSHGITAHLWVYYQQNEIARSAATVIMEDNLVRLQILEKPPLVLKKQELEDMIKWLIQYKTVSHDLKLEKGDPSGHILTALGVAFLRACAGPRKRTEGATNG